MTTSQQLQMFYDEGRKIADLNNAFMDLVRDGLTHEDLTKLIALKPERYERFAGFLNTLPKEQQS